MTAEFAPTIEQQRTIANHLVSAVVDDATGVADGGRCVGEPPSAKYYLGTLAPYDLNLAAGRERKGRETPTSAGFEFEVTQTGVPLIVKASAVCYFRVLPSYAEQLEFAGGDDAPAERAVREYRLAPAFVGRRVEVGPIEMVVDPSRPVVDMAIPEFEDQFRAIQREAATDPETDRREGDDRRERFVPGAALSSAEAFEAWKSALPGTALIPTWHAKVSALLRPVGDTRWRLSLSLVNLSEDPYVLRTRRGETVRRHDDGRDHFLFQIGLEVTGAGTEIVPIRTYLGPDAYRYDDRLAAYANNCGVEAEYDATGIHVHRLWSVPAPVYEIRRLVSTDHPSAAFETLAMNPIPALRDLAKDMRDWMSSPVWSSASLPTALARRKDADRLAFETEIKRFEDGIHWLDTDRRLLLAFRFANETMTRLGTMTGKQHPGWRLFQLVFIVSQLSALAWREHDPSEFTPGLWGGPDGDPTAAATVLFFPTSGGKTEAYLGLIACALFYDRLRGKGRGVAAWCRFPLRLLTLQQTQRQVNFIAAADEVRKDHEADLVAAGGGPGEPFAVGFFVGEGNTPNSLSRDPSLLDQLITDGDRRRAVRVVDQCPYCRKRTVEVLPPDPATLRLVHQCQACGRDTPVVVVDHEIYRYLPSLIVGTLDKLANVGLTDKFGALLGDVDCECAIHGLGRGGKCHERRAKGHGAAAVTIRPLTAPLYDASPSLEIVDELHMVDEDLGAFSGHYEGALAAVQRRLSARSRADGRGVRMKVIATTATIKGEDRQVEHLFGLRSVVMPLPGPSLESSFYWRRLPDPMRRFVGIQPNRTTAEQALVRILQAFHREIRRLQLEGPAGIAGIEGMDRSEFDALLDLYTVSLTYVTSLVDFGKLRRSMDTQVNEYLSHQGVSTINVRELSGDTSFDDVRVTLDGLEKAGEDTGAIDGVIATSMVSHGVDIERLNVMVFNGMPKSTAEYIQASSRVGRRYLGLVFMIFNPVRERDRSHFRYHGKFHEYLDRMVAPVAINRWSRYAALKTLPGVLMADILQIANRDYWDSGHAPAHLHDLSRMQDALRPPGSGGLASVRPNALLEVVDEAYQATRDEAAEIRPELEKRVEAAVTSIRSAGAAATRALGGRPQYRGTADYLGLEYTPMTSLRDIEEGLPFYVMPERRRP